MVIQPKTDITLYTGVDIGTDIQLGFSARNKQKAYFQSKILKQYVNCTVVKEKNGSIKVAVKPEGQASAGEITGAELASANYMSFINPSFDNKTIYCYIVDYVYLNNETAEISYVIDPWQTWLFELTFEPMYIDREHLSQADWVKVEANPYRKDVAEMVTAEPLPTPKGYEKPVYDVAWFNTSDTKDGKAILTSSVIDDANDMVHGDWKYWNVMLIQAPTDWTKFATEDSYAYVVGDCCYRNIEVDNHPYRQSYYCGTSTHGGDFNLNDWLEITIANADPNTGMIINNPYQRTYKVPGGSGHELERFAVAMDGHIYMNTSSKTQTFNVDDPTDNTNFQDNGLYAEYSASAPLKELNDILERYSIQLIPAGSTISLDQEYAWSAKPHGCEVFLINDANAWSELSTFYSKYNAISQIVALYGVPKTLWNAGTIDKTSIVPSLENMDNSDNYDFSVSAMRTGISDTGAQVVVRNKKLYTAPFSYFRVISPTGDIKEYDYESFANVAAASNLSATDKINFKVVADISGDAPKIYFIPVDYKLHNIVNPVVVDGVNLAGGENSRLGTALANTMKCNLDEAICVEGFPQISFNTDGYLTFLASEYAMTLANYTSANKLDLDIQEYNTRLERNLLPATFNMIGSMTKGGFAGAASGGGVAGVVGGAAVGGVQGAYNAYDAYNVTEYNRKAYQNVRSKYSEAGNWASGLLIPSDNPDIERFNSCKPAYANNAYVGGTGGIIRYLRGMGLFDFVGIHVQLRPEILDYYDKWFDMYGYTSCRCGIPYVIQWCRSSSGDTYASNHVDPHWVSGGVMDGTTYIKTKDCKVEHTMMPVAKAVKAMFDNGIRIKKGDLS